MKKIILLLLLLTGCATVEENVEESLYYKCLNNLMKLDCHLNGCEVYTSAFLGLQAQVTYNGEVQDYEFNQDQKDFCVEWEDNRKEVDLSEYIKE